MTNLSAVVHPFRTDRVGHVFRLGNDKVLYLVERAYLFNGKRRIRLSNYCERIPDNVDNLTLRRRGKVLTASFKYGGNDYSLQLSAIKGENNA